jgi:hypothetical protein
METKENSVEINQEKSKETKMVVIAFHPDGTATVKHFTSVSAIPDDFVLKGTTPGSLKKFDKVPKHLSFLLKVGEFKTSKPKQDAN